VIIRHFKNELTYTYMRRSSCDRTVERMRPMLPWRILVVLSICVVGIRSDCPDNSEPYGGECWCSQNFYSATGQPPCTACTANTTSVHNIGSSTCLCEPGFYSVDGTQPCNECEDGSFNTAVGSTQCTCSAGFIGVNGNAPCSPCPSGSDTYVCDYWYSMGRYYCPDNLHNVNYQCLATYYRNGPGQSTCHCSSGYYSATGDTSQGPCLACPIGSGTSPRWCYVYGEQILDVANEVCFCFQGFYSSSGTGPCEQCPLGTTNGDVKQTSCSLCALGYFSAAGTTPCTECPVGTSTASIGSSSCSVCDTGYYSPTGGSPCAACPSGTTTASKGATDCVSWSSIYTGGPTPLPTAAPTGPTANPTTAPTHALYTPLPYTLTY
jgi:Tyrosine-protein kinase ephrin type A/B receptor-like